MFRPRFRRFIAAAVCAAVILCVCPVCGSTQEVICAEAPSGFCGGNRILSPQTISCTTPYTAKAALGELGGIIKYAIGEDPVADKKPEDPGQNTKNNVAIAILTILRNMRPVRSLRMQLEPYSGNIKQLCFYSVDLLTNEEKRIPTGWLYDYDREMIYTENGTGTLGIGYDYNFRFNTFFAADDPWQRNFGFCKAYDILAFLIGDALQTVRIPFTYNDKEWMIQIWKGIYSWYMLGAEMGIYTKPSDRKADFYDCASDPDRLEMSFTVYLGDEEIIATEHELSWWQTAFTPHRLTLPSRLTLRCCMDFPNEEMMNAFVDSVRTNAPQVQIQKDGLQLTLNWT